MICSNRPELQPLSSRFFRSTCVLDALAHGGIVDSEKFNQCMDCWRRSLHGKKSDQQINYRVFNFRSSDESLQTATACLTSLPQVSTILTKLMLSKCDRLWTIQNLYRVSILYYSLPSAPVNFRHDQSYLIIMINLTSTAHFPVL